MSITNAINHAEELGVAITANNGKLKLEGPTSALDKVASMAKPWKPELLKVLAGETVEGVGDCDQCGGELLGLVVHDGYVNRVCPQCGKWFRCLSLATAKPVISLNTTDLVCNSQPIPLF